jgi:acetylornithine deacetylase/succinyl-diaminopimelate desuccinylase-like protein
MRSLVGDYAMVASSNGAVGAVLAQIDKNLDHSRDLLRIPSISTQPVHEQDVRQAAEWLRDQLAELGFKVAIKPTARHPIVLGQHPGPSGTKAPRILFYGHYDVQPPDPPERLWCDQVGASAMLGPEPGEVGDGQAGDPG